MARMSKVETLLNVSPEQLMQMSRKDLATNVSILASAANKRLKRLEQAGVYSPSLEYVQRHGGKFSVAGKNKNQLMIEYFRVQAYMESKTSSVRGARAWQKNVKNAVTEAITKRQQPKNKKERDKIKEAVNAIFTDNQKKAQFWDIYSRLNQEYDVKDTYRKVWDDIAGAMSTSKAKSTDDIFEMLSQEYEARYQTEAPIDEGEELRLS